MRQDILFQRMDERDDSGSLPGHSRRPPSLRRPARSPGALPAPRRSGGRRRRGGVRVDAPGQGFRLLEAALARGIDDDRTVEEAPAELRALFASVDHVPLWVDWEAVNRGGAAFLRTGFLGGILLAMQSLVLGYASPGGNKPLAFSGRLREQAERRLAETSRFVYAVSQANGMRRSGEGFAITVKVRVMHAQVRRLIRASGGGRRPSGARRSTSTTWWRRRCSSRSRSSTASTSSPTASRPPRGRTSSTSGATWPTSSASGRSSSPGRTPRRDGWPR